MAFRTLDDLSVKGKRVLVRADLNVPMADGKVTDTTRIRRQALTIRELSERGARVIVLSHFDRPKGKVVPPDVAVSRRWRRWRNMSAAPSLSPVTLSGRR